MDEGFGGAYISLFSISLKDALSVLRKMKLKELCRMRRSSKQLDQFVARHSEKIRAWIDCNLIIDSHAAQCTNVCHVITTMKPTAVFIPILDPIKQLQCARFVSMQLRLKTWSIARLDQILRPLQFTISFYLLRLSCALAEDYPALEALQVVNSIGYRFDKIFVGVAEDSFITSVPEFCKNLCIMTCAMTNFHELKRFEIVFLGLGPNQKANRQFVCFLQNILTEGGGSLVGLYIRDKDDPRKLDFLENVELQEVVQWDERPSSPTVYLARITKTDQVAVIFLYRGYQIYFVPNKLEAIILAIFTCPLAPLQKVPLDLSSLYEQLLSLDTVAYGTLISNFIMHYNS